MLLSRSALFLCLLVFFVANHSHCSLRNSNCCHQKAQKDTKMKALSSIWVALRREEPCNHATFPIKTSFSDSNAPATQNQPTAGDEQQQRNRFGQYIDDVTLAARSEYVLIIRVTGQHGRGIQMILARGRSGFDDRINGHEAGRAG